MFTYLLACPYTAYPPGGISSAPWNILEWTISLFQYQAKKKKEEPATNYHPYRHVLFKLKHAEVCLCWSNQVPTLRSLVLCCK